MTRPRFIGGGSEHPYESLTVTRSIDAFAGKFELAWFGAPSLTEGISAAVLTPSRVPILTGTVERVSGSIDNFRTSTNYAGRDIIGDLVDSTASLPNSELLNKSADAVIAALLPDAFELTIVPGTEVGSNFDRFVLNRGETIRDAIQRVLRARGLLAYSRGDGGLVIRGAVPALESDDALVYGRNIRRVPTWSRDSSQRFRTYIVIGQAEAAFSSGIEIVEGSAEDLEVGRERVTVILADHQVTEEQAREQAAWEAARRAARARSVTVEVVGWEQSTDAPWEVDMLVPVTIPGLGLLDATMLISDISYRIHGDGTVCTMTLVREDAFAPGPEIPEDTTFNAFEVQEQVDSVQSAIDEILQRR